VTLAIGVGRMAKRRAIIRRLAAVETLGSTTVICSDKTGTLTENAMTVRAMYCAGRRFTVTGHGYNPEGEIRHDERAVAGDGALRECLVAGALCNDASLARSGRQWTITGDPTEAALLVVARKGGLDEHTLNALFPRHDELPFDASRQFMATAHAGDGERIVYVKGALERLLPRCVEQLRPPARARRSIAKGSRRPPRPSPGRACASCCSRAGRLRPEAPCPTTPCTDYA
jgi:cation-transporting ATPase F